MDDINSLTPASPHPLNSLHRETTAQPSPAPVVTFTGQDYGPAKYPFLGQPTETPEQAYTHLFLNDGNLKASGVSIWEHDNPSSRLNNSLILETGNQADRIHLSQTRPDQLTVEVNGQSYRFANQDSEGKALTFHFKTHGGNDRVHIDPSLTQPIRVDAGDGDDRVQAGGGYTRLMGGKGNDVLRLGGGVGYAEGGEGDDTLIGGTGENVMYGNNGNDRLFAGAGSSRKTSYLDGGNGDDRLYASTGHTVLHGGAGNDRLIGHGRSTFYTGTGGDTVLASRPGDRIHAETGDTIKQLNGAQLTLVSADTQPLTGLVIEGSAEFIQRVEDDLALLRSSPQGKQMLAEMNAIGQRNGAPVTVVEDLHDTGSGYIYGSQELKALFQDERAPVVGDDPKWGFMVDGVPGSRADRARVSYNRSRAEVLGDVVHSPITVLYHEMVHAYNAGNGTSLAGSTVETINGKTFETPNLERQAAGLDTSAQPFDFDNDPATPKTSTNPAPFTENALLEEMGKPLRTLYAD